MSGFAQWLALREPYDLKARSRAVLACVAALFRGSPSIAVVDLACGTGATLRAVGPRLPARQSWKLVDNDLSLLAKVATLFRPPELIVTAQPVDLVRDLEAALDGPVDLVTASALLDLVSAEWIERLVVEAAVRRFRSYAALSYDGRVTVTPKDPSTARLSPPSIDISTATRGLVRRWVRTLPRNASKIRARRYTVTHEHRTGPSVLMIGRSRPRSSRAGPVPRRSWATSPATGSSHGWRAGANFWAKADRP